MFDDFWVAHLVWVRVLVLFDIRNKSVLMSLNIFAVLTLIANLIVVQLEILIAFVLGFVDPIVLFLFDLLGFDGSRAVASFLTFKVLSFALSCRIDLAIQFLYIGRLSGGSVGIASSVRFGELFQMIQLVTSRTYLFSGYIDEILLLTVTS